MSAAPAGAGNRPGGGVIRRAGVHDRSEVVRMRRSLWPDSAAAEVDDLLAGGRSKYMVLVAERPITHPPAAEGPGGSLCGFAEVGTRPYAEGCDTSPVAYLEGIWVDPDLRRSGVGAALVRECVAWALRSGLTEMASDCDLSNLASQAFHAAAGFQEVQRLVVFRRSLGQA